MNCPKTAPAACDLPSTKGALLLLKQGNRKRKDKNMVETVTLTATATAKLAGLMPALQNSRKCSVFSSRFISRLFGKERGEKQVQI